MVQRLILHLGDHKTGSTSIQRCIITQGWSAPGRSICFPSDNPNRPGEKTSGHHAALSEALRPGADEKRRDALFSLVASRMADSDAEIGVLSSEEFETVDPEALQAALRRYFPDLADSARLITYVRPHIDRIVSNYAELAKKGAFFGSLAAFHEKSRDSGKFLYHPRFSRWREVFGDQFTLRPMIRDCLTGKDVVRDFFDFALEGAPVTITDDITANTSLGLADLSLLRESFAILAERAPQARPGQIIRAKHATELGRIETGRTTRLRPHRALVEDMIDSYRDDAEQLDAGFFDATPMADALLAAPQKAVETEQSMRPEDHFSADELRLIRVLARTTGDILAQKERARRADPTTKAP